MISGVRYGNGRKKKVNWCSVAFILLATVIPLLHFSIFYIGVNFNSFFMAFQRNTVDGTIEWGFSNFVLFFQEFSKSTSLIREAFKNTALSWLVAQCCTISGFLVSFFLYKKIAMHKIFRIIFFMPGLLASTVVSSIFANLVGVDGALAKMIMQWDNLSYVPDLLRDVDYANKIVFLNTYIFGFASGMIIWGGAFSRIPADVVEAAKLDGINWWREIIYITIPLVWPTVALNLILALCGFFGASGNVFLLTRGEKGTMTLNCWMYLQVLDQSDDSNALNYMSAVGMCISVVAITISLIVRRFTDKSGLSQVQF